MTKTLTEQWRDGTLPDDTYYWKVCKENWIADKYEMYDYTKVYDVSNIECLAPVPSYEEFVQQRDFVKDHQKVLIENMNLKRKLEIATKALKEMVGEPPTNFPDCEAYMWAALQALKEMEGVK